VPVRLFLRAGDMTTKPSLRVLPGGVAGGDPLRELYEKYGGSVYGRCVFLLRDRSKAEDAMQEVFAKALEHYTGFRQEASPLTWLMKIATHHCLNLIRSEHAPWRGRFERDERNKSEAAGGPQVFETRDQVRRMLAKFDQETQAAAVHYYVDEMTLEEVAALIWRSVPTVRKRLEDFAAGCKEELS